MKEPEHQDDTPLRAVEDTVDETDDDADFTDQTLSTDASAVVEEGDGSETFFAPTDPVLRAGPDGRPEIAGGFSPTAEAPVPARSSDGRGGDEAIADAVRDALSLDASTADLQLIVGVDAGAVRLRGTVSSIEDAENAEAVASAVPGVTDVADETDLA